MTSALRSSSRVNDLACPIEQTEKDLKGLFLDLDSEAVLPQLCSRYLHLKQAKTG
jgi:hypothetical protein